LPPIQSAEALHAHSSRGLFPARADQYGDDVRRRLGEASAFTLTDYLRAQDDRARVSAGLLQLFADYDLLLSPVAPGPPPRFGETATLRDEVLPYTVLQNFAGVPACAFPIGTDQQGLPVAAQLTGPPFADRSVLAAVQALAPSVPIAA
jgi:aspartyl-tRNA(Asn)/glutamyl-tRNA(Gln) amidotransferase subunit A